MRACVRTCVRVFVRKNLPSTCSFYLKVLSGSMANIIAFNYQVLPYMISSDLLSFALMGK